MGQRRGAYRVLLAKVEGKTQLGRPKRRCKDSIKMDLQKGEWAVMSWINLAQNRDIWRALMNVMNLRSPQIYEIAWLADESCYLLRKDSAPRIPFTKLITIITDLSPYSFSPS
jgi:hypothetical protein